ncbi:MAG: hypothetical protein WBA20_00835 [Ketobacter sp.]|nr:MAG: hypothetical protein D6160_01230 [Ketobacter sp.]
MNGLQREIKNPATRKKAPSSPINNLATRMHTTIQRHGDYYVVKAPDGRFVDTLGEDVLYDANLCRLTSKSDAERLRKMYINGELVAKPDRDNWVCFITYLLIGLLFAMAVGILS